MKKYAKIINEETKQCDVGLGNNIAYYISDGMVEMDVEQSYTGAWYLKGYAPPKPAPTYQEQIEALENSITARNIREALLDPDGWAAQRIASINTQIEELRKQL